MFVERVVVDDQAFVLHEDRDSGVLGAGCPQDAVFSTSSRDPEASANKAAWKVLEQFERPFLVAFSDLDPVTKGGETPFLARVPGAQGQPHTTIEGAGHFLQEDQGPLLAALLVDFMAS